MATVSSFKQLTAWQRAMEVVEGVYKCTARLPKSETFGLIGQMRRAAVSIPSNIAEGKNRGTRKDYTHFLHMAYGSSAELETQILIAKRLYPSVSFIQPQQHLEEVQKMLSVMIKKLSSPKTNL